MVISLCLFIHWKTLNIVFFPSYLFIPMKSSVPNPSAILSELIAQNAISKLSYQHMFLTHLCFESVWGVCVHVHVHVCECVYSVCVPALFQDSRPLECRAGTHPYTGMQGHSLFEQVLPYSLLHTFKNAHKTQASVMQREKETRAKKWGE